MEIIELLLDEESENAGIEAISIVESGAIESDFIAMAKQEIQLAQVDKEQKLLMIAEESKDEKQIAETIQQLINSCTYGKVDALISPIF